MGPLKKDPHGRVCVCVGSWDHMSSSDVGLYEFKRSPWMQMEECSAPLARSTSDGSADDGKRKRPFFSILRKLK